VTINGKEIKVEVDFLAPEYGGIGKTHRTQKVQDMHPRKTRACDLVFLDPVKVMLEGSLPGGGKDRGMVRVSSIVPFIIMKSQALNDRLKEKDAYDIYYCLVNYPDGLDVLAGKFLTYMQYPLVLEGLDILAEKYKSPDHVGAVFVTDFLEITDPESRMMVQRDAYERVNYLLRKIGIIK
jgi:predicted nucleotidyltransferase